MNPVYTGKDVTYIDTKQAQRAAEAAVLDGERLATLAWLAGADYPAASLDKAWRQLVFGAHHDAITGSEGDQVYLDLLGSWREAWERGDRRARAPCGTWLTWPIPRACARRTEHGQEGVRRSWWSTRCRSAGPAWPRSGWTCRPAGQRGSACMTTPARDPVPGRGPPGRRRRPRRGHRHLPCRRRARRRVPQLPRQPVADARARRGWRRCGRQRHGELRLENEAFVVEADPARGGTLSRVLDKRSGTELLQPGGGGNELVLQPEHPGHPRWAEGPWLLCPAGPGTGSGRPPRPSGSSSPRSAAASSQS